VVVKKKTDKWRLCVDFRQINAKSVNDAAVGDVVWAKEHHLSQAAEGFAAKLAPRYDGPYQVMGFASPVI